MKIGQLRFSRQRNRKKMRKNEHSLRDLWDTIKYINIYIIGVSGKKREKEKGENNI